MSFNKRNIMELQESLSLAKTKIVGQLCEKITTARHT